MNNGETSRTYPTRPYLAVSAAIFRDGRVLIVRRARPPAHGIYTLPGGGVELGETLEEAVIREVREETALEIEPVALAGYRQAIARDADGPYRAAFRHFAVCGALGRRRDFAQRGIGRGALAASPSAFRVDDDRGLGADRGRGRGANCGVAVMPGPKPSVMPRSRSLA